MALLNRKQILSKLRSRGVVVSKHDLDIIAPAIAGIGGYYPIDNGGSPRVGLATTPAGSDSWLFAIPSQEGEAFSVNAAAGTITVQPGGAGLYNVQLEAVFAAISGSDTIALTMLVNGSAPTHSPGVNVYTDAADPANILAPGFSAAPMELNDGDVVSFLITAVANDALVVTLSFGVTLMRLYPL